MKRCDTWTVSGPRSGTATSSISCRPCPAGRAEMARSVAVLLGTKKGVYAFRSGAARERWRLDGLHFPGQPVYHVAFDPRDGQSLFAGINGTWGGRTWRSAAPGPAERAAGSQPDVMWGGIEPASLFKSTDRGESWESVRSLNDHPDTKHWSPGGGGLGLPSIIVDAGDAKTMAIGISSAGVYETTDGGKSW